MAGHSDGPGDTSIEGVEPFLRWEEKVVVSSSVLADAFFCFSSGAALNDQDLDEDFIACCVIYNVIRDRDAGREKWGAHR